VLPLFSAVFIDLFSFGLMYPVIILFFHAPSVLAVYGGAARTIYLSLALSLLPFGMLFGASLLGDLSDALGRTRTLLICMAGLTAAYALMLYGVASLQMGWLLAGRLLSGLMAGTSPIAQAAVMDMSSEKERGRNTSDVVLVNSLALVCGPAAGGGLAHVNFRAPLIFAICLCVLAGLWIATAGPAEAGSRRRLVLSWREPFAVFSRALHHPAISRLAASFLLFQLGFALYYIYVMLLMRRAYELSGPELGAFAAVMGSGFVIGSSLGYRIAAARLGSDLRVAVMGLVGCGICILLTSLPLPGPLQWVMAALAAIANLLTFVALLAMIGSSVAEQERGWALGIGSSMSALAFLLAGLMELTESFVSLRALIGLGGAIVLAGVLPLGLIGARQAKAAG
jgi:predicted MFS family arabinose efflux permease